MLKRKNLKNINIKKILTIYTVLILAIATYISIGVVQKNDVNAATGWTKMGAYPGCNEDGCTCSNAGGCDIYLHICDEWYHAWNDQRVVCYENPRKIKDMANGEYISLNNILAGVDCKRIQVDLNIPGSISTAGNLGAITLEWSNWATCGHQDPFCPYSNTQARVQKDITDPWKPNMSIDCGTSFRVGGFHDNTGEFASDTQLQVVGPNFNQVLGNGGVVTTTVAGTYSVYATTRISGSSNFYPEEACKAVASVICTEDNDENPDFTLSKVATNANGSYDLGAQVKFKIVLQNTGDTTMTAINFRDSFDNRYLTYVSAIGTSPSVSNLNITSNLSTDVTGNITNLINTDLTSVLGDLAPGQSYSIDFTFTAKQASHSTCNDVFAHPTGLTGKQARACVGIVLKTDI